MAVFEGVEINWSGSHKGFKFSVSMCICISCFWLQRFGEHLQQQKVERTG